MVRARAWLFLVGNSAQIEEACLDGWNRLSRSLASRDEEGQWLVTVSDEQGHLALRVDTVTATTPADEWTVTPVEVPERCIIR
jgi:hypothetical protein